MQLFRACAIFKSINANSSYEKQCTFNIYVYNYGPFHTFIYIFFDQNIHMVTLGGRALSTLVFPDPRG